MAIRAAGDNDIMFLPSQFAPSLQILGPQFISDWLEKNRFDILSKRYIVFPLALEYPDAEWGRKTGWMLCAIANPGSIINEFKEAEDQSQDQDIPGFLFRSNSHRKVPRRVIE